MTKQLIAAMVQDGLDIIIIPEGEGEKTVRALVEEELSEGAVVIRSSLVTPELKFNSVHVEVIGDFSILYH
jgi:hypothetical protein